MYRSTFSWPRLVAGDWSASRFSRFAPWEKAPSTHCIRGWVGPRVGPDDMEKRKFFPLPGFELRPFGRPASIQSLYWLRYPGLRSWLKHYATSRKVAGSIHDEVIGFFNWHNPSSRTQPLTEMSTRNRPGWVKGGRRVRLTTSSPFVSRSPTKYGGPRRVTPLRASMVCYRDSFTFYLTCGTAYSRRETG
jgi:hypothetical protein